MLTSSETILNLLIWSLTGSGLFFGGRAAWRRRQRRRQQTVQKGAIPASTESLRRPP